MSDTTESSMADAGPVSQLGSVTELPSASAAPAPGAARLGGPFPDYSSIEVTDPDTGVTVTRFYTYVEPDPATTGPLPLVLAFHGGGGNMRIMYNALGFDTMPGPRPYLTVIPQGFGPDADQDPTTPDLSGIWNSGQSWSAYQGFTGPAQDDVNFIDALLLEMTRRTAIAGWRIDQSRTYAVGFSNGGMMAYRLAAERSSDFAAVAIMQAGIGGDPDPDDPALPVHVNHPGDHGAEPVSVLQLHGLLDPGLSLTDGFIRDGLNRRSDLPVMDGVDIWVAHNGCERHPTIDSHPMGVMRTWADGDAGTEVKLLTMPSVAHQVPDGILSIIEPFLAAHHK